MPKLAHTLLASLLVLLCHCTVLTPEQKAGINRVVVVSSVGPEITRYKLGLTIFNNHSAAKVEVPALRQALPKVIQEEVGRHFKEVRVVEGTPPTGKLTAPWAQQMAASHKADAVFAITPWSYYPYGFKYMFAKGFGAWHDTRLGGKGALIQCYARPQLYDGATGKKLGPTFTTGSGVSSIDKIRYEREFHAYSAEDQQRIREACLEAFRDLLKKHFRALGYEAPL